MLRPVVYVPRGPALCAVPLAQYSILSRLCWICYFFFTFTFDHFILFFPARVYPALLSSEGYTYLHLDIIYVYYTVGRRLLVDSADAVRCDPTPCGQSFICDMRKSMVFYEHGELVVLRILSILCLSPVCCPMISILLLLSEPRRSRAKLQMNKHLNLGGVLAVQRPREAC